MNTAFILVNCDMGYEIDTINGLKKLCNKVQGTYGIYDFICKLDYNDMQQLEQVLQKIRHLKNVSHTVTIHTIPEQS